MGYVIGVDVGGTFTDAVLDDDAGTIFLVSHSMKSIRDTCERALWINRGTLMMDGPCEEVVAAYEESKR